MRAAVERLSPAHRNVPERLDAHGEEILGICALPEEHRKRMRTTNMLKRFNWELKRRTRAAGIFPNFWPCIRVVGALAMEANEEVIEKRYLTMTVQETDGAIMAP